MVECVCVCGATGSARGGARVILGGASQGVRLQLTLTRSKDMSFH